MTGSALPLLFLDVDGPLIPFGATREQLPGGYPVFEGGRLPPGAAANPLVTRIDPAHGPRLLALPCTLVWATTWMADANECLAPWLGLPELPMVDLDLDLDRSYGAGAGAGADGRAGGLHWKTRPLLDFAAGRPFAWVDDEITQRDRAWVRAHHPGQALLHHVDPRFGLTEDDFAVLGRWLRLHRG